MSMPFSMGLNIIAALQFLLLTHSAGFVSKLIESAFIKAKVNKHGFFRQNSGVLRSDDLYRDRVP